jgi:hypothetical protein
LRPVHWKVHQALDSIPARQPTVDSRPNQGPAKERKRQGSADPTLRAKFSGKQRTELQDPSPHRFIGDIQTARSEQVFDVAIAEGETRVESDGVLD